MYIFGRSLVSLLYVESHCILNQIVTKIPNVQKKYDGFALYKIKEI